MRLVEESLQQGYWWRGDAVATFGFFEVPFFEIREPEDVLRLIDVYSMQPYGPSNEELQNLAPNSQFMEIIGEPLRTVVLEELHFLLSESLLLSTTANEIQAARYAAKRPLELTPESMFASLGDDERMMVEQAKVALPNLVVAIGGSHLTGLLGMDNAFVDGLLEFFLWSRVERGIRRRLGSWWWP